MAVVDTVYDVNNPETGEPEVDPKAWHVTLPNWDCDMAVAAFQRELDIHKGERGVKTLRKYVDKYIKTIGVAEGHLQRAQTAVNTINGIHTPRQPVDNDLRTFKRTTKKYFSMLSRPQLERQCDMLGVDYDTFATQDEIINALVAKSVELRG